MGLPNIEIIFKTKAVSAITRSEKGVVALIFKDDTGVFDAKEYTNIDQIVETDWSADNIDLIKKTFLGNPVKVIVERVDTTALNYNDALQRLKNKKFDYLAVPDETAQADIVTWIKGCRDNDNKTFKAVVANNTADHEAIINFCTEGIVVNEKTYSAIEYTCRIAGVLAGLPFSRSSTYFVLPEVARITESVDPDSDIEAGKLILINDGEKVKIARGVNSLTTTTVDKADDFKKIKIIEGMDLIKNDIKSTFEDNYIGKINNSYDNQVLFITAVNSYLTGLKGDILDPTNNNAINVDVEAQRLAWESVGTDTSNLTDQQIKEKSFSSKVFVSGNLKFLDAMEDLKFNISL